MAISEIPAQVATNAMQAIPFGSMIGGPWKRRARVTPEAKA